MSTADSSATPGGPASSTPPPSSSTHPVWDAMVAAFSKTSGYAVDVVDTALQTMVVGGPSDSAVATLADSTASLESDFFDAFGGSSAKKGPIRKAVNELQKSSTTAAAAPASAPAAAASRPAAAAPFFGMVLPDLPGDDSAFLGLLKKLQTGGVLAVEPTDVLAGARGLLAQRVGVFGMDRKLLNLIAMRARELRRPNPPIYYTIKKALARKAHADVLQALEIPSSVASKEAVDEFLGGLQGLFDQLAGFDGRLDEWRKQLQTDMMTNPAAMASMFNPAMAAMTGFNGMEDMAPDTAPLADAASGIIDAINLMFSGDGVYIARAVAADAMQLEKLLDDPTLLPAVNCGTMEELGPKIDLDVGRDTIRTSQAIAKYVWYVLKLPEVPVSELPIYINSLKRVGASIPWATLTSGRGGGRPSGIGSGGNGRARTSGGRDGADPLADSKHTRY